MIDLFEIARRFSETGVDFVIVGGHSNSKSRRQLHHRSPRYLLFENPRKPKEACISIETIEASAERNGSETSICLDWTTLQQGTNFTFTTAMGDVDLLGEVKGVGMYDDLIGNSIKVDLDGYSTHILSIPSLIIAKKAAARPKDEAGLKVLYALQEAEQEKE